MAFCSSKKLRVALFGIGRAGEIHLRNLLSTPGFVVKYVVDVLVDRAITMVTSLASYDITVLSSDNACQVFADPMVDAVVVASPTATHQELVETALRHGKTVFCEKPIANTEEQISSCYRLAKQLSIPLHCSFNRRFDPSIVELRNRVQTGQVGRIYSVSTVARDSPFPPLAYLKSSQGIFHDCAVHDIDVICWTIDEFPVTVYAQTHCHRPELKALNDVDTVNILMKFKSGILADINISRNGTFYDQRLEVCGELGQLQVLNQPRHSALMCDGRSSRGAAYQHSFAQRYAHSYVNSLRHFRWLSLHSAKEAGNTDGATVAQERKSASVAGSDCMQQGTAAEDDAGRFGPSTVTSKQVLAVCRVAAACHQSAQSGLPVQLDWEQ